MKNTWLSADIHLDHKNIIKYCSRPFESVADMNDTIVFNWNNSIAVDDDVLFMGDITFGEGHRPASVLWDMLNGNKTLIKGNHDHRSEIKGMDRVPYTVKTFGGLRILFIHSPEYQGYYNLNHDGWIIHGHHHNNNTDLYPFFSPANRTINVGVEVTNYKPVRMDYLLMLIKGHNEAIKTLDK